MHRYPISWYLAVFFSVLPLCICAGQGPAVFVEDYRFGHFSQAEGLDADSFGNVFVTDGSANTVWKFRMDGTNVKKAGGPGWDMNQFDHPCGIDAHIGITLYVADRGNHRIVRMDKELTPLGVFTTREDPTQENSFGNPLDVAMRRLGNLLILDGENNRVVSTTGFATIERSFGGVESGEGRLHHPTAMAVSEHDTVFVLDDTRIVVFDGFGNYLYTFGNGIVTNARNISLRRDRGFITAVDSLIEFTSSGELRGIISRRQFIFAAPVDEFRDALFVDETLLLLSQSCVIVCRQH